MAKKNSTGKVVAEVGAGLAAVGAAAAAGYYFYGSKDAKKHQKVAAKWANDLKKDVVKQAKKMPAMDAAAIATAVDSAVSAYQGVRSIDAAELKRAAAELKRNWEMVKKEARGVSKKSAGSAKKAVKSVAKKGKAAAKKTVKRVTKKASPKKRA